MELSPNVITFFSRQGFVIVSTFDPKGYIHCSAKGLVDINQAGRLHIIDLYLANTFNNIKNNPIVSITAVDEHEFTGYTLKGKAKIVEKDKIDEAIIQKWKEKVVSRASTRVIKNIRRDKSSPTHPESRFPEFKYLIEVEAEEIVDLSPAHLKRPASS